MVQVEIPSGGDHSGGHANGPVEHTIGEEDRTIYVRPYTLHNPAEPNGAQQSSIPGRIRKRKKSLRCRSHDGVGETVQEGAISHLARDVIASKRSSSVEKSSNRHRVSPVPSRSSSFAASSRPTLVSGATSSSMITLDTITDITGPDLRRRPSLLGRLRLSIATANTAAEVPVEPIVHPEDFRMPPEYPEKRYIDSIGMVIPGACDRVQCVRSPTHFVTSWRLCEPYEYTTALADHGITYTDYNRLLAALEDFLDDITTEPRRSRDNSNASLSPKRKLSSFRRSSISTISDEKLQKTTKRGSGIFTETMAQFRKAEEYGNGLNRLLADITWNFRARGTPVMICIGSFALFAPRRISEAHVQILHVPLSAKQDGTVQYFSRSRISSGLYVDPFKPGDALRYNADNEGIPLTTQKLSHNRLTNVSSSPKPQFKFMYPHQATQQRDRSQPWPLWPNSIPMRKRTQMEACADRYGVDPLFRQWMRAAINSGSISTSYAKYMIERENDPMISKRLDFVSSPRESASGWDLLLKDCGTWTRKSPNMANRYKYEHNRKLEARKTVELGFRLRLARFAFRNPIYPPHTPEMQKLGLTLDIYEGVLTDLQSIRDHHRVRSHGCAVPLLRFFRKRGSQGALPELTEYIRKLNAKQRGVVWTLEEIPGVYERNLTRNGKEWEISIWNGEDPLELLLQLEKWGIIEKRLTIDEEDMWID